MIFIFLVYVKFGEVWNVNFLEGIGYFGLILSNFECEGWIFVFVLFDWVLNDCCKRKY